MLEKHQDAMYYWHILVLKQTRNFCFSIHGCRAQQQHHHLLFALICNMTVPLGTLTVLNFTHYNAGRSHCEISAQMPRF